ncbi:MAG: hypothetical protein QM765_32785 [Myxococcales bacterium]
MNRSRLLLALGAAGALLVGGGEARADLCFGRRQPPRPQTTPAATDGGPDGGLSWGLPLGRQLGTGLLAAAALSTGWVCFRRKGPNAKE